MSESRNPQDRNSLLANVAEMYYLRDQNQDQIASAVGVTRSMVSRMLKEARQKGIVDIRIRRPLHSDDALERELRERFGLLDVMVVALARQDDEHLLDLLGAAGAQVLLRHLKAGMAVGLAWGTSVSAVVGQVDIEQALPVKVIQLVGALGARNREYDGHGLVTRLAERLGAEGYYLNAPYICPDPKTAQVFLKTESIAGTIQLGNAADVALLGIGSTEPKYSSYYLAGYVPIEELDQLRASGAIGDVCGIMFDADGNHLALDFSDRLVAIRRDALLKIPVRLGVAGGEGKVRAILGALRAGFVNVLVTDSLTARRVLEQA